MEADPWPVLGKGMFETYVRVVDGRLGLEEESDAPFAPVR